MKKVILYCLIAFIIGMNVPYKYNPQKAVSHITATAHAHSKCMCAWYVMRALQKSGVPSGIYPAYAYSDILPKLGFIEVPVDSFRKGDISVLSTNSKSNFGHIAIYDGQRWISDYKQSSMFPNSAYRVESECRIYRQTDGWHTANIWVSPIKLIEYIQVLINNYQKINFI